MGAGRYMFVVEKRLSRLAVAAVACMLPHTSLLSDANRMHVRSAHATRPTGA